MSDETQPTPTPAVNGGETQAAAATPAAAASAQPGAGPTVEPYRTFATEADLTKFLTKSKQQAERAALRKLASDLGFEDADELREALEPLRRGQGAATTPPTPVAPQPPGPSEMDLLNMALDVAEAKGLPVTLAKRIQGKTKEEMEVDADRLLALVGSGGQRSPGIPPAPQASQPVTFTRSQLADPDFVRKNKDAIIQASREGRLVRQ